MKSLFASADFGIIGLIIFILLFIGAVGYLIRPGAKEEYKKHGHIPLEEDHEEKKNEQ